MSHSCRIFITRQLFLRSEVFDMFDLQWSVNHCDEFGPRRARDYLRGKRRFCDCRLSISWYRLPNFFGTDCPLFGIDCPLFLGTDCLIFWYRLPTSWYKLPTFLVQIAHLFMLQIAHFLVREVFASSADESH
jgi:hypothetical protein